MDSTVATYKFGRGLAALLMANLLFAIITWTVFSQTNAFEVKNWKNGESVFLMLFTAMAQLLLILLLLTQYRYIIIDSSSITFRYPLLPFLVKRKLWTDFDYYKTVAENSRVGTYESIWLIKDNRLKMRISSFYYTNYAMIKSNIKTRYKGNLNISPLKQLYCLLSGKI